VCVFFVPSSSGENTLRIYKYYKKKCRLSTLRIRSLSVDLNVNVALSSLLSANVNPTEEETSSLYI